MKPFVLDRYGRIVFPFNFLPELDFSVFHTLEEFETVVRRDFEELLEAIDLVVPHQANKTMVTNLARGAGLPAERLYFNIERVGNTSAASIPLALHDAVHDGVIDRPLRVFAPGFGAGAVGGYVVMRVAPSIAA
jgi:3-oxoacyl-[acyl-carrier-protein] synthase III